ncbi:MAG: hypothetical protein JWP34_4491 [Massilia sp.]|jgi:hypothetical protein|nr:hypothetical protein [Massilia sp.]
MLGIYLTWCKESIIRKRLVVRRQDKGNFISDSVY